MEQPNIDILNRFEVSDLPDLDVCTLGALELFSKSPPPALSIVSYMRPLVVGSVNAASTGQILFHDKDVVFADQGTYKDRLEFVRGIDGAILISASGGKHAVGIAEDLKRRGIATWLLTNNADAPASQYIEGSKILVFPKNREPYTYNTSTYMGMIFSKTREGASVILEHILQDTKSRIPDDLVKYDTYYLIIPSRFGIVRDMFLTKFDELFGPKISGRVFTMDQSKHAKTVILSETEYFISFGEENKLFGNENNRLHIPLPENSDYGAMMAVGYYVIGHIQKQHPPYFKENIVEYTKRASKMFEQEVVPIVE